jgi:hypothetical protein
MNDYISKLNYDSKESPLYMPNEIFDDLQKGVNKRKYIPFAYSYYYLISWLYRYTKYGSVEIENKILKSILGYSSTYTEIDYLIKKNGILDQIGYTLTEKDYPTSWLYDGDLEFTLLSDFNEDIQKLMKGTRSRKFAIKYPIKAFHRNGNQEIIDGTFYEFDRTHLIPFEVFLFCMSKKEIGVTGFYLWSYLKMKNQLHKQGYDISIGDLSDETMIPRSTLCEYLGKLRGYRMIDCYYNQEFFCLALKEDDRKANTYVTNERRQFSDEMVNVEKIKFVNVEKYENMMKEKANVDLEGLFE